MQTHMRLLTIVALLGVGYLWPINSVVQANPNSAGETDISVDGSSALELIEEDPVNPPLAHLLQPVTDESGLDPEAPLRSNLVLFPPETSTPVVQAPDVDAGQAPSLKLLPEPPEDLPFEPEREILQQRRFYTPSITILTPSGYGRSWGQAAVGIGGQARTRFGNKADGAIGLGFGLGDAERAVGLDISLAIVDLSGFDRGLIGFKLHRRLPEDISIAVGVNDAIQWGDGDDAGISPYGVITKRFVLQPDPRDLLSNVYVSAGAGTGRYRTEADIFADRDDPAPFGSVAVRVAEPVNIITEWSGQDLSLGVSVLPFRRLPLVLTPAITDITGTAGDGVRFIFSVGYGISF